MNIAPQKLIPEVIHSALRQVIDPELGCNIVDLGLIYGLDIQDGRVAVQMTLTSPGCPMGSALAEGVRATLNRLPGVTGVEVNLVWDPPWSPSMIDPAALETA